MIDADAIEAAVMQLDGRKSGAEIRFLCPAHADHRPSARYNPAKQAWFCDVCNAGGGLMDLANRLGVATPGRNVGQSHVVATYDYHDADGKLLYQVLRHDPKGFRQRRPDGNGGWVWKLDGVQRVPYRLPELMRARYAVTCYIVEGEKGADRLASLGLLATTNVGGAGKWKDEYSTHLAGRPVVVIPDNDQPGRTHAEQVAASVHRAGATSVHVVPLPGLLPKGDICDWLDMGHTLEQLHALVEATPEWTTASTVGSNGHPPAGPLSIPSNFTATAQPPDLARSPRILDRFARDLARSGVAGEARAAKLLYLAVTSRLLERPISVAVKGPSSGGKSFLVEKVLEFFPSSAYYALSAMSERALAYSQEPLSHRMLVIYEAVGLSGDMASYLIRSLLSEGKVRYETVERGKDGLKPRLIERDGPTGLIVTTTAVRLHPENETRMLSILVNDTKEQTRDVLLALAGGGGGGVDLTPWHELQAWSNHACHDVTVLYATALAELIPPVAVRLRRDFGTILSLIRAHAILHQATRERAPDGSIIANELDYEDVRDLVADLVAEGIEATVSPTVRETVEAVTELAEGHSGGVTVQAVALHLKLDKATALRRVRAAIERGYIENAEERRGRPARLFVGDPLPRDLEILPSLNRLLARMLDSTAEGCMVAAHFERIESNPQTEPF
ncbi:MAG: hypothetical protein HYX94_01045 [Chloroflexi bacterium]|nr:hypothetical protein [Chloroflexota bacterium]